MSKQTHEIIMDTYEEIIAAADVIRDNNHGECSTETLRASAILAGAKLIAGAIEALNLNMAGVPAEDALKEADK